MLFNPIKMWCGGSQLMMGKSTHKENMFNCSEHFCVLYQLGLPGKPRLYLIIKISLFYHKKMVWSFSVVANLKFDWVKSKLICLRIKGWEWIEELNEIQAAMIWAEEAMACPGNRMEIPWDGICWAFWLRGMFVWEPQTETEFEARLNAFMFEKKCFGEVWGVFSGIHPVSQPGAIYRWKLANSLILYFYKAWRRQKWVRVRPSKKTCCTVKICHWDRKLTQQSC